MSPGKSKLIYAENIARQLFNVIEERQLVKAGKTESELNQDIFKLAEELFGIRKYWHKRIVRSGPNTLIPYEGNPPNLVIQEDDILFMDFGPILEEWEADVGRTFVIGTDPIKHKLKKDIELAWHEAREWFHEQTTITGAAYWYYILDLTKEYGYTYGGTIGGHLIGHFPHENLNIRDYNFYIHPENPNDMLLPDEKGNKREWILEIHFVDKEREIGGFFEQLLT